VRNNTDHANFDFYNPLSFKIGGLPPMALSYGYDQTGKFVAKN